MAAKSWECLTGHNIELKKASEELMTAVWTRQKWLAEGWEWQAVFNKELRDGLFRTENSCLDFVRSSKRKTEMKKYKFQLKIFTTKQVFASKRLSYLLLCKYFWANWSKKKMQFRRTLTPQTWQPLKEIVSWDDIFVEGPKNLNSTFWMSTDGFHNF